MHVELLLKSKEEAKQFIDSSMTDYTKEIAKTYDLSLEEAEVISKRQLHQALNAKGTETEVFTIVDASLNTGVGGIWISLNPTKNKVFVYQILINEKDRGKGYGKASLQQLDQYCKQKNYKQIELSVFGWNKVAFDLYLKSGYEIVRVAMKKVIR